MKNAFLSKTNISLQLERGGGGLLAMLCSDFSIKILLHCNFASVLKLSLTESETKLEEFESIAMLIPPPNSKKMLIFGRIAQSFKALKYVVHLPHSIRGLGSLGRKPFLVL